MALKPTPKSGAAELSCLRIMIPNVSIQCPNFHGYQHNVKFDVIGSQVMCNERIIENIALWISQIIANED